MLQKAKKMWNNINKKRAAMVVVAIVAVWLIIKAVF
tara:strand:- start:1307 stop:1414 length:108 start_codon:yes stop_codon:yes gene_type:complete